MNPEESFFGGKPAPTELSAEIRDGIRGMYALYAEYLSVGFTEEQALRLLIAAIQQAPGGQG